MLICWYSAPQYTKTYSDSQNLSKILETLLNMNKPNQHSRNSKFDEDPLVQQFFTYLEHKINCDQTRVEQEQAQNIDIEDKMIKLKSNKAYIKQ